MTECKVEGCSKPKKARGMCGAHYEKWRCEVGPGKPDFGKFPPKVRFWAQLQKGGEDDCWQWTGTTNDDGYGKIGVNGKKVGAHRYSYELHNGPIPEGMHVLHSCDNPGCANPKHLSIGTHKQNMEQRDARGRNGFSKRTHCKRGHEFTPENTKVYKTKNKTSRHCLACRRLR